MLKQLLVLLVFLLFHYHSKAQLVNIESQRMKLNKDNFKLRGNINFNYSNNDGTSLTQMGTALTTAFRFKKDSTSIYFFTGSYNLAKSKTEDFRNSWFFHLRYNKKLINLKKENPHDNFRLEAFLQNLNNKLQTINSRNLVGAGIRWKFINYQYKEPMQPTWELMFKTDKKFRLESFKAYFGNSYMYEIEKVQDTDQVFRNSRNNSYLSLTANFTNLEIINTIYFQPLYSDFTNYRISEQLQIDIPFSEVFSFSVLFNYFYNSYSPNEVNDYNSYINFGLSFSK